MTGYLVSGIPWAYLCNGLDAQRRALTVLCDEGAFELANAGSDGRYLGQ